MSNTLQSTMSIEKFISSCDNTVFEYFSNICEFTVQEN